MYSDSNLEQRQLQVKLDIEYFSWHTLGLFDRILLLFHSIEGLKEKLAAKKWVDVPASPLLSSQWWMYLQAVLTTEIDLWANIHTNLVISP